MLDVWWQQAQQKTSSSLSLGREVSGALRFVIVTIVGKALKGLGIYTGFYSKDITIRTQDNIIKMNHKEISYSPTFQDKLLVPSWTH